MKMVKSLLLGTAAGLVAMSGAQAADLPVKAKAVQYVKICSLYGAGFYYIPGTDTCLKVGGWVRMQMGNNYNGNMSNGPLSSNVANRSTNDFMTRNRGYITADARSQTEYGTLRAYIAVGISNDNPIPAMGGVVTTSPTVVTGGSQTAVGFSTNRAFIQLGGFTAGLAQSFYDFTNNSALSYNGATAWYGAGTTTGDPGWQVLAYTAQLGGGLSATISAENARNVAVTEYNAGTAITAMPSTVSPTTTSGREGNKYPDIVANLRVDQAWGSAQVMGAIHDASAAYNTIAPATVLGSHPSNATGYAIGGGIKINFPMVGKGDYLDVQAAWAQGASKYVGAASSLSMTSGASKGSGTATDAAYGLGSDGVLYGVQLTKTWGFFGGYQHYWNPKWKTSVYGGYVKTEYNSSAQQLLCSGANLLLGCNANWSTYNIGTRTAWAPVPNLEVGVDVMYSKLNAANSGTALSSTDQSAWTTHLRIQRDFYP